MGPFTAAPWSTPQAITQACRGHARDTSTEGTTAIRRASSHTVGSAVTVSRPAAQPDVSSTQYEKFSQFLLESLRRFDQYITVLKAAAASSAYVTLNFIADNSVDKEIAASISSDIYLIAISIVIFVVLAVTFLTRCAAQQPHMPDRNLSDAPGPQAGCVGQSGSL